MKKTRVLVLLSFLLIPALSVAQTAPSGSNATQQLRRIDPPMQNSEQDFGPEKLGVSFEKGIAPATKQAMAKYFTEHYKIALLIIDIYKLPSIPSHYFVIGTVRADGQAEELSLPHALFLVLKAEGATISEVGKAENESDAAIKEPVFFTGQDKVLIVVSLTAADGGFSGNPAFEYSASSLKSLGEIFVFEGGNKRPVFLGKSPMGQATAEYKNKRYYLTMRGAGSLYELGNDEKKLAPPKTPVTFFYDGTEWRPAEAAKPARRK